jgi:hypothetical protein
MIKANELRIGNWVMYYDKPLRVDDLTYLYDLDDDWEGWVMNGAPIEKDRIGQNPIDPIPLTPEILEKAGFKSAEYTDDLWLEIGGEHSITYRDGKLLLECHDSFYNINFEYQSLHSLQNLYFALTGEELDIAF